MRYIFLLFIFFSSYLFASIGVTKPKFITGVVKKINTEKNFVVIENKKYFYPENLENILKRFLKKKITVQVKKNFIEKIGKNKKKKKFY